MRETLQNQIMEEILIMKPVKSLQKILLQRILFIFFKKTIHPEHTSKNIYTRILEIIREKKNLADLTEKMSYQLWNSIQCERYLICTFWTKLYKSQYKNFIKTVRLYQGLAMLGLRIKFGLHVPLCSAHGQIY